MRYSTSCKLGYCKLMNWEVNFQKSTIIFMNTKGSHTEEIKVKQTSLQQQNTDGGRQVYWRLMSAWGCQLSPFISRQIMGKLIIRFIWWIIICVIQEIPPRLWEIHTLSESWTVKSRMGWNCLPKYSQALCSHILYEAIRLTNWSEFDV